ncbi:MAG: PA14 domain-containing protein [Tepidisphaeraceae bacterium]
MSRVWVDSLEGRTLLATPTDGVTAKLFNEMNFTGSAVTANWKSPAAVFGTAAPVPGIDAGTYSVRWTGKLRAPTSENFRFYATVDGGMRLWIGRRLVIDSWSTLDSTRTIKADVALKQGKRYDITLEYRHNTGSASMQLRWQTATRSKETINRKWFTPDLTDPVGQQVDHALAFARDQLSRTIAGATVGAYPLRITSNAWETVASTDWTSGYTAGALWQIEYALGGTAQSATVWSQNLVSEKGQPGDHFGRLWPSIKALYDRTGSATLKQALLDAAAAKNANWSDKIGAWKTPELGTSSLNSQGDFGVLMDQTMDLELMWWAGVQKNDATLKSRVIKHAQTVIAKMQRTDGSVVQRAYFNSVSGNLITQENYQGYSNSSTWSRAQAWAVYAFSTLASLTGDAAILAAAKKAAGYFYTHLPSDHVPYWDFALPSTTGQPRDSSAAAIAATGLYRLSTLTSDATYRTQADTILSSLVSSAYLADSLDPALASPTTKGILLHGSQNVPKSKGVDTSLMFGDYYLLQAINAREGRV